MLLTHDELLRDPGPAVQSDPEVREARMIAAAARSRLLACLASPQEAIDLAEARQMLDAIRDARAIAQDAEDRVLVHHGLLTPADAERRAAARRPAACRDPGPAGGTGPADGVTGARVIGFRPGRGPALAAIGHALLPLAAALVAALVAALTGAALARNFRRRAAAEGGARRRQPRR